MKESMIARTLFFLVLATLIVQAHVISQTNGDYRSKGTGNWGTAATWQIYSGGSWIDASAYPTSADGVITIRNGHTVTIDETTSITIDQLVVETGATLATSGPPSLTVSGTINGTFSIGTATVTTGANTLYVNNGTLIVDNGGTFGSVGGSVTTDNSSTISIGGTATFFATLIVNTGTTNLTSASSTAALTGEVYVAQSGTATSLVLQSGKDFTFKAVIVNRPSGTINGPGTMTYAGAAFYNNGTVNADVKFNTSDATVPEIRVSVASVSASWNNVEIDDADGVVVNYLAIPTKVTISGTLTLTNGKLTLGSTTPTTLTIGSSGSISGASSSRYIVTDGTTGYLVRNVPTTDTDVLFPVGTATTYNPLTLNNKGGTADNYSVRVANSSANVVDATKVVGDQWTINEAVDGGSNITLTAQWNVGEEGVSFGASRTSAQLGRYLGSGTLWNTFGTTVSGSGPYTAHTTSSITGTGVFVNSVYGIGLPGALPVELASFTATTNQLGALLQWTTATEVNNLGFEIERRPEGSTVWTKIGFIAGAGTSNAQKVYIYTDQNLAPGVYVYRLKQIDNDGTLKYSASAQVDAGVAVKAFQLCRNYPNPFNPMTTIHFSVPEDGYASLKVYNILGQEVATLFEGIAQAGHYIPATFDASRLASGVFFSRLQYNGKSLVQRMLLTK